MSHIQNYKHKNTIKETFQMYDNEDDKALEIKKIEYQQRFIVERIRHLELQRKQMDNYLNFLQSLDDSDEDENVNKNDFIQ
jgi:hypothetical protein